MKTATTWIRHKVEGTQLGYIASEYDRPVTDPEARVVRMASFHVSQHGSVDEAYRAVKVWLGEWCEVCDSEIDPPTPGACPCVGGGS